MVRGVGIGLSISWTEPSLFNFAHPILTCLFRHTSTRAVLVSLLLNSNSLVKYAHTFICILRSSSRTMMHNNLIPLGFMNYTKSQHLYSSYISLGFFPLLHNSSSKTGHISFLIPFFQNVVGLSQMVLVSAEYVTTGFTKVT